MKKNNSFLYFFSSVLLIIIAIGFIAIINRVQDSQNSSTDVRARASAPGALQLTGVVSGANEAEGTILVDNLTFKDATNSLGTWTVTPPPAFNFAEAVPGASLRITVDPKSMLAQSKTLSAIEIIVSR